ncbi:MAG: hypothetical protein KOO63_09315 [Bacteroidales bacterium]|nr:hypothetical protein [Candidatus Latescibacterota bacterium]
MDDGFTPGMFCGIIVGALICGMMVAVAKNNSIIDWQDRYCIERLNHAGTGSDTVFVLKDEPICSRALAQ